MSRRCRGIAGVRCVCDASGLRLDRRRCRCIGCMCSEGYVYGCSDFWGKLEEVLVGEWVGISYLRRPRVRRVLGQSGHAYGSPVSSSMLLGVEFRVGGEFEGISAELGADGIPDTVCDEISSTITCLPCGPGEAVNTSRISWRSPYRILRRFDSPSPSPVIHGGFCDSCLVALVDACMAG